MAISAKATKASFSQRGTTQVRFTVREVDIDSDPALYEAHRYDVPVIEIDGRRAFKHRVTPRQLVERLSR